MATPQRVLIFDVETAPLLSFHWKVYKENIGIDQMKEHSYMLTWAAKWWGEDRMYSMALKPSEAKRNNDHRIIKGLASLMREADHVVAHNSAKFDVPTMRARLWHLQQPGLGPMKQIDTLRLSRQLRLPRYNLEYLARMMGIDGKHKTDFDLWAKACTGDKEALQQMLEYNEQDVRVLEQVFESLLPHVDRVPRMVNPDYDMEDVCPYCGSPDRWRRGYVENNASRFVKYQCRNPKCGKYYRGWTSRGQSKLATRPL